MNRKYSVAYGVIALATFCMVAILGTNVCLGFSKTYAEDPTCQYLRTQKSLSIDYICTLGLEYTENGSSFIQATFNRPNNYFDQKNYVINEISKEITATNNPT
jgi:hypothetical protein